MNVLQKCYSKYPPAAIGGTPIHNDSYLIRQYLYRDSIHPSRLNLLPSQVFFQLNNTTITQTQIYNIKPAF
jgi:hypothetical protein